VNFFVSIVGSPPSLPPLLNQHIFLVSNLLHLAILVGKKWKNSANSKNNCQKIEITNFNEKRLPLLSKKNLNNFNNSNIKHINNSNIKFM
jgi:hypothetical protein